MGMPVRPLIIPPDAPDELTIPELACELYVSEATIYRWIRLGKLPRPTRVGRFRLLKTQKVRESLAKWAPTEPDPAAFAPRRARPAQYATNGIA